MVVSLAWLVVTWSGIVAVVKREGFVIPDGQMVWLYNDYWTAHQAGCQDLVLSLRCRLDRFIRSFLPSGFHLAKPRDQSPLSKC